jgi:hypothetical protein
MVIKISSLQAFVSGDKETAFPHDLTFFSITVQSGGTRVLSVFSYSTNMKLLM